MKRKFSLGLAGAALTGTALVVMFTFSGCASAGRGRPEEATAATPFVNTLGLRFVPVPGTKILMCTTETTVAQYEAAGMGYEAPDFPQEPNHCAVNISQLDAKAWCRWLSKRDGRKYRLPTDAEWSAAVGAETYPWGETWPPPNNSGNYAGQELRKSTPEEQALFFQGFGLIGKFSDGYKFTAPVGSYPPNSLGIHDLGGNAWEWCGDINVLRGASWFAARQGRLTSSARDECAPNHRDRNYGFRCVLVP